MGEDKSGKIVIANKSARIVHTGKTLKSADSEMIPKMIARGLGAKIIKIPIITKEEAEQYEPLGSPVMMSWADELNVYHFGSRMLNYYGQSLDDVIGYRILELDEETEFRQECSCSGQVVRYYGARNQG